MSSQKNSSQTNSVQLPEQKNPQQFYGQVNPQQFPVQINARGSDKGTDIDEPGNGVITTQPRMGLIEPPTSYKRQPLTKEEDMLYECANILSVALCAPIVLSSCFCFDNAPLICPKDYEKLVMFRLGKLKRGPARGPGVFCVNPFLDEVVVVDMRTAVSDVELQEVISQDAVKMRVTSVVFYRAVDALTCTTHIINYKKAIVKMGESAMRNVIGKFDLSDLLEKRNDVSRALRETLAEYTTHWGVEIERVELTNLQLPTELVRAMATEGETSRLANAKVILSKGEEESAHYLAQASACLNNSAAVPLRSLETLAFMSQKTKPIYLVPIYLPSSAWDW